MLLMQTEYQMFLLVVGEGVYEENMCSFLSYGKNENGEVGEGRSGQGKFWTRLSLAADSGYVSGVGSIPNLRESVLIYPVWP